MSADFDVGISSPVPLDGLTAIADELKAAGAHVELDERGDQPQASLVWLAAAFGLWISRKYFEKIAEKAAEDHYDLLKRAAKKLMTISRSVDVEIVTSQSSPNKAPKVAPQVMSVTFFEGPGRAAKFVFAGMSEEQGEYAMERMFELLERYCWKEPSDETDLLERMIESGARGWKYYLVYDADRNRWTLLDVTGRSMESGKETEE